MPSPTSPSLGPSAIPAPQALAGTWIALSQVQTQACADWLALCMETSARCALTRSVPEYLAIGSLMLPSCLAHAMHYCKRVSEIVQGGLPASALPPSEQSDVAGTGGGTQRVATGVAHA